ncbi:type II toxin-antitoxin system VapC family toxin [Anatilimnocola sp. NA78]|uniref:type II toxin-antitoxin system VapC family toxin n=1 Tax=Anatilimnocola sp. NA78 TaxID=3415683 RepID=UPI003CE513C6
MLRPVRQVALRLDIHIKVSILSYLDPPRNDQSERCHVKPTVYIETSIVSYLRSNLSSQVVAAARQLLTREWWEYERAEYSLVTSQYVLDEAAEGSPELAAERLAALSGIRLLPLVPDIGAIANEILARTVLPQIATVDALHIAIAVHHRVDYLLTWNCKHIANAKILPRLYETIRQLGLPIPIICTPEEMVDHDPQSS